MSMLHDKDVRTQDQWKAAVKFMKESIHKQVREISLMIQVHACVCVSMQVILSCGYLTIASQLFLELEQLFLFVSRCQQT